MANGFGSMFIGVAGLQSSQNALNVTSSVNSVMALVIIHSPRHLTIGRILVPLF